MKTIKIILEIDLNDDMVQRIDAAAEWSLKTRQQFIRDEIYRGCYKKIEEGVSDVERIMARMASKAETIDIPRR